MKKLQLAILTILISAICFSQDVVKFFEPVVCPITGYVVIRVFGASGFDYNEIAQSIILKSGIEVDNVERLWFSDVVDSLQNSGLWDSIQSAFIFSVSDKDLAVIDWKDTSRYCTPVNSPIFTPNRGYRGVIRETNATSAYINTNINPALRSDIIQDTVNYSVYINTNILTSGDVIFGVDDNTNYLWNLISSDVSINTRIHSLSGATSYILFDSLTGFNIASRIGGSDIYEQNTYLRDIESDASSGKPNKNIYLFAHNDNGVVNFLNENELACFIISKINSKTYRDRLTNIINYFIDIKKSTIIPEIFTGLTVTAGQSNINFADTTGMDQNYKVVYGGKIFSNKTMENIKSGINTKVFNTYAGKFGPLSSLAKTTIDSTSIFFNAQYFYGGTYTYDWLPDGTGYYGNLVDTVNAALALSDEFGFDKKVRLIWYQGESNALSLDSANIWLEDVNTIFSSLATDFNAPILEIIIIRIHNNLAYSSIVRAAQETFDKVIDTDEFSPTQSHIGTQDVIDLGIKIWERDFMP